MINDVRGLVNNEDFITLRLNGAIDLTIFKQHENNGLKIEYDFDPQLLTKIEAKEIIDYFIISEGDNLF